MGIRQDAIIEREADIKNQAMPFEVINKQIKNSQEEILAELQSSLEKNNAIGIFLKDSHELITTAVTEIKTDPSGDFLIRLMDHDLHGFPLERTRIMLTNIDRVIHFNLPFDDPQFVKLRRKEKFKA
jgi:hypothetical protein